MVSYDAHPTYYKRFPPGFDGNDYGKALLGCRLAEEERQRTTYLKDIGVCFDPRKPENFHEYTIKTGGKERTRNEIGEIKTTVSNVSL